MSSASTLGGMSPQLLKVVERARREPEGRFHSLAQSKLLQTRVADGSCRD